MILRLHRIAHALHRRRVPILPRIAELLIRVLFAAHLPAGLVLPRGTRLGHNGLGSILNRRARIGRNCFIGSHVVLGGQPDRDGAPTLGDDVVVHSGARIFGPIEIGAGSVIAANAVVTRSCAPRSLVGGIPARVLREEVDHRRYRPNAWRDLPLADGGERR